MPRVDWQRTIPPQLPWTDEDVRIFLALPIQLQATSIYADAVDYELIVSVQRCFRTWGYDSVPAMLRYRVEQDAAR